MDLILKLRDKLVSLLQNRTGPTTAAPVLLKDQNRTSWHTAVLVLQKHLPHTFFSTSCLFQIKARRQQLPVQDGVFQNLDTFIRTLIGSLRDDLQDVLETG